MKVLLLVAVAFAVSAAPAFAKGVWLTNPYPHSVACHPHTFQKVYAANKCYVPATHYRTQDFDFQLNTWNSNGGSQ